MNNNNQSASLVKWSRRHLQSVAAGSSKRAVALVLPLAVCLGLTGCFGFLKPAQSTAHHYVLTPMSESGAPSTAAGAIAIGIGPVKLPAYLFNSSLALRRGTNEIEYLPSAIWAERLDAGFQRVLAANLALALPTEQIHLSAWRRDAVNAEVYVALEQFDVDETGRGVLIARWRILSPGGEKVLRAGASRLSRQGPGAETDPAGIVANLSELLADFSRELAKALHETVTASRPAVVPP